MYPGYVCGVLHSASLLPCVPAWLYIWYTDLTNGLFDCNLAVEFEVGTTIGWDLTLCAAHFLLHIFMQSIILVYNTFKFIAPFNSKFN